MADIDDYFKAEKSLINLESDEVKGDLGLGNYVIEKLTFDTIALEFVDINKDGRRMDGGFLYSEKDIKTWRVGKVLMVGPNVKQVKVGDLVHFPGTKGISTGTISIRMPDGSIYEAIHGHFIAEDRIQGCLSRK